MHPEPEPAPSPRAGPGPLPPGCPHDPGCHDGAEPVLASAPPGGASWLLIEHPGPWPEHPLDATLSPPARAAADTAAALGIRVQLIRRAGRPRWPRDPDAGGVLACLCSTSGPRPWLRRGHLTAATPLAEPDLRRLARGQAAAFGAPAAGPLFLVCAHGRRNACCARLGGPLARALARQHADVWETTHVGGDRYAANLVVLPHGLYYGPVTEAVAAQAIAAYQRGQVILDCFRGRTGQDRVAQEAQHAAMLRTGSREIPRS